MTEELSDKVPPHAIVVGVDGSDSSKAALRWAWRQAGLSGDRLVAVGTWELPASYGWAEAWPADINFEDEARKALEDSVDEVIGADHRDAVTTLVLQGHPAPTLGDLSRHAAMVVVGSRGHGEFAGMLLGSVSEFLSTHAHCPVVIIRDGDQSHG